jgi:hypothetical protein
MTQPQNLILAPSLHIGLESSQGLVALGVGSDDTVYTVSSAEPDGRRARGLGGIGLFKTRSDRPQRYTVRAWSAGVELPAASIDRERASISYIQPLDDSLLLVCPRCRLDPEEGAERNGRVYGRNGVLEKEITFGDGIEQVYVAPDQTIWVSYFDEGVVGSFGW